MPRPTPTGPDPDRPFPWEDDDEPPGISIRPLSHADLAALLAEWDQAGMSARQGRGRPTPTLGPEEAATIGRPGGSAEAEYWRRRTAEQAAWIRTLTWRVATALAAGAGAALLVALADLHLALLVGVVVAAGVGWMLRFRPSSDTRAWQRGALGERRTAQLLGRLERHGWTILHDLAIPGSRANIDHLLIGPGGVVVVDSKQYRGRLQLDPYGNLWHGRYPLASVLRAVRFEADQADQILGVAEVQVAAIVAVHGTSVPWGQVTASGVTVVPAAQVPRLLGAEPAILTAERVAWLADRARLRFRPAA
jgi:Nuclease-related domain